MLACVPKYFRKYFNLASVSFEAVLSVPEIVRLARNTYAARLGAQILERQIERFQYVIESGVYVAIPEKVAEAKPLGKPKDDKGVRSRFSCRFRNSLSKLNEISSRLTAFESDAQRFPFPRRVNWQKYVSQRCRRSHHDVAMDEKLQIGQCPRATFAVCMIDEEIATKIKEPTELIWVAIQDCIIES